MKSNASRVLIVDDMAMNRLVLSSLLASYGVISDQAESGMECIRLCEDKDYDLILLDHRMPDMDGVDTLVRLKDIFRKRGVDIPVICHTSKEALQNINLYKAAGFSDVLIKPIEPGEFFNVVMVWLKDRDDSITEADESAKDGLFPDYGPQKDNPDKSADPRLEIEKLPLWLKFVPHINLVAGIANCGSADDYLDALYIFYSSIEDKAEEIQAFGDSCDWTMYALRVHSLKSMARLVGAERLGELAAGLEAAAREGNTAVVQRDTKTLLDKYREFSELLSRFSEEDVSVMPQKPASEESADTEAAAGRDLSHTILLIQSGLDIVGKGIENKLSSSGFTVIPVADEPDQIIARRDAADIIIYHTGLSDSAHTEIAMNLLGEICQDDCRILCLTGEMADLNDAMRSGGAYRVSKIYPRPIDLDSLVRDMDYFAGLEQGYHRKKTVYVVDDDMSYLRIIEHWLSAEFNVSAFSSGADALSGMAAVTPDLILLDYEMPDMNGFELMKIVRSRFSDINIPIIFLTGKNDSEHVFKVIGDRPDGYILKASQKETILYTIRRFFSETMFRSSLAGISSVPIS